jgi:hypothetical protein
VSIEKIFGQNLSSKVPKKESSKSAGYKNFDFKNCPVSDKLFENGC